MIKRDQPSYYDALPGIGMVDRLLTTTAFGTEEQVGHLLRMQDGGQVSRPFRLTADGRPDIHDIYRAYSDGYSIVLNRIEARSPIVGEVCRQLEADVQHRVGANLYVTPRDSQGARAHIDAHDVIIAQIDGVKSWRVATDPRTRNPPSRTEPIDIPHAHTYLLHPGDALYIPRGYAHEGVTSAASSAHLTFGFYVATWGDLLKEAVRLIVADNPDLQRPLPVGHLHHAFEEQEVAGLAKILSSVPVEAVLETARLSIGSQLLERQRMSGGHFVSLDAIHDLTIDSIVKRAFDGPCRIHATGDQAIIHYPGNYLSVPYTLRQALEHAAYERIFTIASIPGTLDDDTKIRFVARLIREGFLAIANS